ncbi:MAG: chalcone isomerase family protein [Tibeticola sp.]
MALGFGICLLVNLLASLPAAAQGSATAATAAPSRCSEALLRVWGFEVYTARLCAGEGFRADAYARSSFTLELRYLRAFKAADIARRSIEEMRRSGPLDDAQARAWRELLERTLPDVQPGDRITGIHEPGRGVRFLYNGQPRGGPVGDAVFAERFFGIWLAPQTSEPALREALLAPLGAS